jgi:hypothetical protein
MQPGHDKSAKKSQSAGKPDTGLAPPRLSALRRGIRLQPVGRMLVRWRNRTPADAGQRRGLPVPGVFEEGGGGVAVTLTA